MDVKKIDKKMDDAKLSSVNTKWYSSAFVDYNVHGLYWFKENSSYKRLRDNISISEGVDNLSTHPSGAYLSFKSNTTAISLRVKLANNAYMSHMSACGQCGLDLYFLHKNEYIFLATTKINKAEYEITIVSKLDKSDREYRLYLPLYIKLISLEIGIDSDSYIEKCEEYKDEAIVCYGTSISQGGCATRPGMNYTSILGRMLPNYEVYNLGFSGSAKLEEQIAREIVSMKNVKYLIIEAEANTGSKLLLERFKNFMDIVTKTNIAKIFVITHYPLNLALVKESEKKELAKAFKIQKEISSCYNNVVFIDGKKPLKFLNYEETVDGYHLTDLGFYVIAKFFANLIRKNEI